jgi:pimeloyl-ACP methyl ester carboxylesterase
LAKVWAAMSSRNPSGQAFDRLDADFASGSERCAAWLYLPVGVDSPAVVVMGHGFAAQRDFRLPAFAEAFASRGYAVLLFDYRGFGESAGMPRQLVSPRRHLQDWSAAVDHAANLPQIDRQRIALWGSSFGGGHALVTAARRPEVRAVIAQVPYVDSLSTLKRLKPGELLQAAGSGIRDLWRAVAGRDPYTVPVYGRPGEFACMNTPESASGYAALVPPDSAWTNACPARIFLTLPMYRPIASAARIEVPALLLGAEDDELTPLADVEACAARIKNARIARVPGGHFSVYQGAGFDRAMRIYLQFLDRGLGTARHGREAAGSAV